MHGERGPPVFLSLTLLCPRPHRKEERRCVHFEMGRSASSSVDEASTGATLNTWFAFLKTDHRSSIAGEPGSVSALNAGGNPGGGGHGAQKGRESGTSCDLTETKGRDTLS